MAAVTPLAGVRERFPGLRDGWARLDGPAGTQMVDAAIDAMADFMRSGDNANHGGVFRAAEATDELVATTRETVGRLLGGDPTGIVFGPSMTALTMRFAATVARDLGAGDEVVCTRLDHDANVSPWVIAAERAGATVRFADPEPGTLELPASAVEAALSDRTRWVAVTASPRPTPPAPASTSTPSTPRRTARSTSSRSAATRSSARPTSGSAPTRRSSGADRISWRRSIPTSSARRPTRSPTASSSARCRSSRSRASARRPSSCSRSTATTCAPTRTRCWRRCSTACAPSTA
jgi:hypothetical protein